MKKAEKKAQKLGVDAVAQTRGGVKIRATIKAGSSIKLMKW